MSSHARILIIDDNSDNVVLLSQILKSSGYEHIECLRDASLTLRRVGAFSPDLILLDLMMSGTDGYEVLTELRQIMPADGFLPVLVVTADHRLEARQKALALGATDIVLRPHAQFDIVLRVRNLLQTRFLHLEVLARNETLESQVRKRAEELMESEAELKFAKLDVIERLALVGEHHDNNTGAHTQRVGRISKALSQRLGVNAQEVELISHAAPLHDVGKVAIPHRILRKPDKLTPEEFATVKKHCEIGARILSGGRSDFLDRARTIAVSHHERWDGNGYPFGLSGRDIPLEGRIVAVADVFDVLTHERPYTSAWSVPDAIAEIQAQSGRQFDPEVVQAFCQLGHDQILNK